MEILKNIEEIFLTVEKATGGNTIIYILIFIIFMFLILNFFSRRKILKYVHSLPNIMNAETIDQKIQNTEKKIYQLEIYNQEVITNLNNIKKALKNIIKTETIKYNPYEDMGVGGKQSFSTALVDQKGNGTILTCLYSRERTRVMTKIVQNYNPEQELSPEEKAVLEKVKNKKLTD
ncbi:hypothetical protein CSB11_01720 [Candidatus Campbellbacteria bacterium]|nr:MAG: hypothetical protein CSB11_01720 [Candidatus Campbellbacteria bacterium]